MSKLIFNTLSPGLKSGCYALLLMTVVAAGCKKKPAPVPGNPELYPFLTYSSLVNDNADWQTLVTTSSEDSVNGYKFEGIFAGMYNKDFAIEIQGRSMNDQYSTGYRLKFDGVESNGFDFFSRENPQKTMPHYYKDPNNENEYYTINGGKNGPHLTGNNVGKKVLYTYASDDASIASIYKLKVDPSSSTLLKTTGNYYRSFDPTYPISMNNSDYTSDFALCGTSRFDRSAFFLSPAGLSSETYLHLPPQSDFSDQTISGSSYSAGMGFFNDQNAPRFLGIHFRHDDNSMPGEVFNVKAKCYYPVNISNTGFRASHYSGANAVRSMVLEKEFLIMSDWGAELGWDRVKMKTLKTANSILMWLDFYQSNKVYYFKYNYVDKEFTTLLPLQAYPPGYNLDKMILSPDANVYYYSTDDVYVIKNGETRSVHNRSMFKDPSDANTAYQGIAMKGDKLLLFVVKDLWVNSINKFDFKVSTIIAKTTF